MVSFPMTLSDP